MVFPNLEEILCDDGKTLGMVCYPLQIRVLVQDIVIDIQEKLEGVLVQEVYLKRGKHSHTAAKPSHFCTCGILSCCATNMANR